MDASKISVLLAEDEKNMGALLRDYLNIRNYQTDLYFDGEQALQGFCSKRYDICILDVMMPKKDGFTLAQEIRQINVDVPIIFLTAKAIKDDIITGFATGADDYITKPFSIEELQMRMEAVLRRAYTSQQQQYETEQDTFQLGQDLFLYSEQTLNVDNQIINLTSKETELLRLLCINPNKVINRNYLLSLLWGNDSYFNSRSLDVFIAKLRRYLKNNPYVKIVTIRGKGYKLIV